jgi:protein-disulfide isomerase
MIKHGIRTGWLFLLAGGLPLWAGAQVMTANPPKPFGSPTQPPAATASAPAKPLLLTQPRPKAAQAPRNMAGADDIKKRILLGRRSMGGALNVRAQNEYRWGNPDAPVHIVVLADPTAPGFIRFWNDTADSYKTKLILPEKAMLSFRPIPTRPLGATAALLLRCLKPEAGLSFLAQMAKQHPTWGQQPYDTALTQLRQVATAHGMSDKMADACLKNDTLMASVLRAARKDVAQLNLLDPAKVHIFVNGSRWEGDYFDHARQQALNLTKGGTFLSESAPEFSLKSFDRVLGNPKAGRQMYLYASILRLWVAPMFAKGLGADTLAALAANDLNLVYRPYHLGDEPSRVAEVAASCVPDARFADFVDYVARAGDIWAGMRDPAAPLQIIALSFGANPMCFNDPRRQRRIDLDVEHALNTLGVVRAPTFFYRGRAWIGMGSRRAGLVADLKAFLDETDAQLKAQGL